MAYPLQLDMGQFLPTVNGKHVEEWYDLRGVLMHKGTSAHHGHYVAQVRDGRSVNLILPMESECSSTSFLQH